MEIIEGSFGNIKNVLFGIWEIKTLRNTGKWRENESEVISMAHRDDSQAE